MTLPLISKTELMQYVVRGHCTEIFSHEHEGDFDVTAMRKRALETNAEVFHSDLTDDFIKELVGNRDVDKLRILELSPDSIINDPVLAVYYPEENAHLLIDGIHRLVRRHQLGMPDFLCWMVTADNIIRPDMAQLKKGFQWGSFDMVDGKPVPHAK